MECLKRPWKGTQQPDFRSPETNLKERFPGNPSDFAAHGNGCHWRRPRQRSLLPTAKHGILMGTRTKPTVSSELRLV